MRRVGGKEKSEPLIPKGTLDSSAIGADEIQRLNKNNRKSSGVESTITTKNTIVAPPPPLPQVQQPQQVKAAPTPTASTRPNPGQTQSSGLNARQRAQLELQQATDDEEESYVYEPKKGHKMCFFICDTKRAVMILTSFDFCIIAFSITRLIRLARENGEPLFDMSSDVSKKLVTQACALFVDVAVVVGALWYSALVVSVGFLFKCYQLVTSSIVALQNWENNTDYITSVAIVASLNVLFLYASAVFMWEVHSGILTKKTYQRREKYSCCCEC